MNSTQPFMFFEDVTNVTFADTGI